MNKSDAWFRLPADLVKDPARLRRVMDQLAAVVNTSNTRKPMAGAEAKNACDEDPECYFLGVVTVDGVVYHVYDCSGEIALYPAVA